jgi:hypothetical protein
MGRRVGVLVEGQIWHLYHGGQDYGDEVEPIKRKNFRARGDRP